MSALRRRLAVAAAALLVVPLAACSGSSDGDEADAASASRPSRDPDVEVRWPRYWATTDQAESGARGASNARFFLGVDGDRVVYNAQDVIRVLDRDTGKQLRQTLTTRREVICAFQPSSVIEDHVLVLATGSNGVDGVQDCQTVRGYDVEKGRFIWSYRVPIAGNMTLGVREGTAVMGLKYQDESNANAIEFTMTGLDLRTGEKRWARTAAQVFREDEAADDLRDCAVQPAIAARRPVVVAVSSCYVSGTTDDPPPRVVGYAVDSGKELWRSDADWMKVGEDGYGLGGDLTPHPNDGSFIPGTRYIAASYVDAKTGKGRAVASPKVSRYAGSEDNSFEAANDFGSLGGSFEDFSVVASPDVDVYVASTSKKDGSTRIRIYGVTAASGKTRYTIDLQHAPSKDPYDYTPDYTFLGLNTERTQFLLALDKEHVQRYDVATGKKVGTSLLAPPLGLTKSASFGKGYLIVRTQGGISGPDRDVQSGLDFYRTDTD